MNGIQVADTRLLADRGSWPQTLSEFELLVDSTQHQLVHYAFCFLAQRADAEDAVQDVFVQAWRDRAKHRRVTEVRPYLFRMVRNRCTDVLRARRRRGDTIAPDTCEEPRGEASAFDDALAREEALTLERLLDQVPEPEAEVIRLRVWSDLPFGEIATTIQAPVPTVKSRFRYGVERLRRLLTATGDPHQRGSLQ